MGWKNFVEFMDNLDKYNQHLLGSTLRDVSDYNLFPYMERAIGKIGVKDFRIGNHIRMYNYITVFDEPQKSVETDIVNSLIESNILYYDFIDKLIREFPNYFQSIDESISNIVYNIRRRYDRELESVL